MRAVVDRIEGDLAVLLVGDEETQVVIPLRLLPEGTRESSILRLSFELDQAATDGGLERARQRIERLRRLSR